MLAASLAHFLSSCTPSSLESCELEKQTITSISKQIAIFEEHNRFALKSILVEKPLNNEQKEVLFLYKVVNELSGDIINKSGGYDAESRALRNPLDTIIPKQVLLSSRIQLIADKHYSLLVEQHLDIDFDYNETLANIELLAIDQTHDPTVIGSLFELLILENRILVKVLELEKSRDTTD